MEAVERRDLISSEMCLQKDLPLKWHHFLTRGFLAVFCAWNLLISALSFGPSIVNVPGAEPLFYDAGTGRVFGVWFLLIGVGSIIVWILLAGFRRHAWVCYLILLVVYGVAMFGADLTRISDPVSESYSIGLMIARQIPLAVIILLNAVYYGKRKELFVR